MVGKTWLGRVLDAYRHEKQVTNLCREMRELIVELEAVLERAAVQRATQAKRHARAAREEPAEPVVVTDDVAARKAALRERFRTRARVGDGS